MKVRENSAKRTSPHYMYFFNLRSARQAPAHDMATPNRLTASHNCALGTRGGVYEKPRALSSRTRRRQDVQAQDKIVASQRRKHHKDAKLGITHVV